MEQDKGMRQGDQGVQGNQGVQGVQGIYGGEQGVQGVQGEQGEKGDPGLDGDSGPRVSKLQLVYLAAVLAVVLFGLLLFIRAAEARNALCVLQGDFRHRANETRTYIRNHPEGFGGISTGTLLNSASNQDKTADLLNNQLHCEDKGLWPF